VTDQLAVPRRVVRLDRTRRLVQDQVGTIRVLQGDVLRAQPFLDVRASTLGPSSSSLELGLAGFQPAPDFATSGTFYTIRSTKPTAQHPGALRVDVLSRWRADPRTLVADPRSEQVIMRFPSAGLDHLGGGLALDDRGNLLVARGAAGEEAQDPRSYEGKILRITPGEGTSYTVPQDNPYAKGGGHPEIYSGGYRNPFRIHADPQRGLLVAHAMWTEMHQQVLLPRPGDNAGYPLLPRARVSQCWPGGRPEPRCLALEGARLTLPAAELGPEVGQIVSGAVIYRGTAIPQLTGKVIAADWDGALVAADPGSPPWTWTTISLPITTGGKLWDLTTDGEHLYLMLATPGGPAGTMLRIERA